jgi:hypothetical protein
MLGENLNTCVSITFQSWQRRQWYRANGTVVGLSWVVTVVTHCYHLFYGDGQSAVTVTTVVPVTIVVTVVTAVV